MLEFSLVKYHDFYLSVSVLARYALKKSRLNLMRVSQPFSLFPYTLRLPDKRTTFYQISTLDFKVSRLFFLWEKTEFTIFMCSFIVSSHWCCEMFHHFVYFPVIGAENVTF